MRRQFFAVMVLCLSVVLTGCGTTLAEMTAAEEEIIVLYSAKMVSKFNRQQDKGYSYVTSTEDDDENSDTVTEDIESDATEETDATEESDVAVDTAEEQATISWNDIIGQEGINLSYTGYEVSTSYVTDDVAIPDADEGYTYIILRLQLLNTTDQDLTVDLLTNSRDYSLLVNGETTADGVSTLSMEDLSTYYNESFTAGNTDDVVLLFETTEEVASNISSLTLHVTKDGNTYSIQL